MYWGCQFQLVKYFTHVDFTGSRRRRRLLLLLVVGGVSVGCVRPTQMHSPWCDVGPCSSCPAVPHKPHKDTHTRSRKQAGRTSITMDTGYNSSSHPLPPPSLLGSELTECFLCWCYCCHLNCGVALFVSHRMVRREKQQQQQPTWDVLKPGEKIKKIKNQHNSRLGICQTCGQV